VLKILPIQHNFPHNHKEVFIRKMPGTEKMHEKNNNAPGRCKTMLIDTADQRINGVHDAYAGEPVKIIDNTG
jgi:hypothetical protein